MASLCYLTVLSLMAFSSVTHASNVTAMAPRRPRGPAVAAQFLSELNGARAQAGVPPLSWNATVAQRAKGHVNWLRTSAGCELLDQAHRPTLREGEAVTFFRGRSRPSPKDAVWLWTRGRRWYDHGANACAAGKQCGSYELVVKRAWRQVGCAVVACASGWTLMACEYYSGSSNWLPNPAERPY